MSIPQVIPVTQFCISAGLSSVIPKFHRSEDAKNPLNVSLLICFYKSWHGKKFIHFPGKVGHILMKIPPHFEPITLICFC